MTEFDPRYLASESGPQAEICTVLKALPVITVPEVGDYDDPAQLKKHIRQEVSVQHTSPTCGFMHGALVGMGDRTYVLAGSSGSGKSSYASYLGEAAGATTLANDWVAIEREGDDFFVSGLDWRSSLKQQERQRLSGVVFLSRNDEHGRDAFIPNGSELRQLVDEAFDTANPVERDKLYQFWGLTREALPFCCAVPVRRTSEAYTAQTIANVLDKSRPLKPAEVGVIGVGEVGKALAFQLGQLATVSKVHLYSPSQDRLAGVALDMNQAAGEERFVPHTDPAEVLAAASSTFLSFRTVQQSAAGEHPDVPERWLKLVPHLEVIRKLAHTAADIHYEGALFVISNPVDILTYAAHHFGQQGEAPLRTYQTYGIGLGVDVSRARYYADKLNIPLDAEAMRVYGNHSDRIVFETSLSAADNARLIEAVHQASEEVRSHGPRTVYAPVTSAVEAFRAYSEGGASYVAAVQDGAHIGQKIRFSNGLPMLSGVTFSDVYDRLLRSNRQLIRDNPALFQA